MKKILVAFLFVSMAAVAQDAHAMHHDHSAGVDKRGDMAMGFDHTKTSHHFLLDKNGGSINVTANSSDDRASVEEIQGHLQHIAKLFTAGDFDTPLFIHNQVPPGVPVMKKLKSAIRYAYEPLKSGGRVTIESSNREAVEAIHAFLQFQIADHRTGDRVQK